jgi:hypothetical protein
MVGSQSISSTIADWGDIYDKLERFYEETGLKFVIDSAFLNGI